MPPPGAGASSAAEAAAVQDYRASIWTPFQTMYEDKWSQCKFALAPGRAPDVANATPA